MDMCAIRKKTTMNDGILNLLKKSFKQEKHPYKWSTIDYDVINTGTSENIPWSNSSIEMWSTDKDWKTGNVMKTGPTEKFL